MKKTTLALATSLALAGMLPSMQGMAAADSATSAPAPASKTFKQEELDQLLAPIALYPDALLAQILMASTYPLEVVEAQRWVKNNPSLKDKALQDAVLKQSWDPAVKSLAEFPQVLNMMSEKLDWTQKLGDAFLSQQSQVMATVQSLRQKAKAQGNLNSSKEQTVVVEQAPANSSQTTIIKIEPTSPEVVYVPTYNPTVVYGAWWYPSYPPYYYYPPSYNPAAGLFAFTAGVAVGAALWGDCNWGHGSVNVNVNQYNSYNRTNISNTNISNTNISNTNISNKNLSNTSWQHNAEHRKGVAYSDTATAQKYNKNSGQNTQARENYRGRAETGQQEIKRGEVNQQSLGQRAEGGERASSFSESRGSGAFDGLNSGGAATRESSNRGHSSRESMGGGGGRSVSGGSRSGGGGGRSGGGGHGGRR